MNVNISTKKKKEGREGGKRREVPGPGSIPILAIIY